MHEHKINIGCGELTKDGYVNIDLHPEEYPGKGILGADALHLPFKDESIDEIYMSHFLEHLTYLNVDLGMREWRRVLKIGGKIIIIVPDMDVIAQEWLAPVPNPHAQTMDEEVSFKIGFWASAIYGSHRGKEQDHRSAWNKEIIYRLLTHFYFTPISIYRKDYTFWLWAEALKAPVIIQETT
jgi:ubiquinone/menaquinone biosynthesis C-methylase UbiE